MKIHSALTSGVLAVAAWMAPAADAHAQSSYQFFARASNLGTGEAWAVTRAHNGGPKLDMSVRRWDANAGKWSACNGEKPCSQNDGRLTWGQPVYAPADGEITSCYRTFPDNPAPGEKLDNVDDPGKNDVDFGIHAAGNNVWLRTDQGDMIALTHMREDSIPESLCPNGDSDEEADDAVDLNAKTGKYVSALYVAPANRPRVKRGQFIGLAGNSGNSWGPHLHIQHNAIINGDEPDAARPVRFKQVYAHPYDEDVDAVWNGWYPLRGDALTGADANVLVHPAPMWRRTDYEIGSISEVDAVFVDDRLAVTAVRNGDGDLQLTSWDAEVGDIDRLDDYVAGSASLIRIVKLDSDKVLVGLRNTDGQLKLILFHVDPQWGITRLADYTAGRISRLDMAAYADRAAVTAVRDGSGNLKLIEWGIRYHRGGGWQIERHGSRGEGPVSALAIASARNFNGVAVAVRTAQHTLKVIPYTLSNGGWTFTRGDSRETRDPITTTLDITALPRGFVAAGRDSKGRLKLVSYWASAAGDLIATTGSYITGTVSDVNVTYTPDAGSDVITTVRDASGELRSISWAMASTGHFIRRGGSVKAGGISRIATAPTSRIDGGGTPRDMLLTAVRNTSGNLKLIYWDVNLAD